MAFYENEQGPYRGYQPRIFDTGDIPAPVRGAVPPQTSTFEQPPVRGAAPIRSGPPTSVFDTAPVRGEWASAPALTTEFYEGTQAPAGETAAMKSRYEEAAVAEKAAPVRVQQTTSSGKKAYASFWRGVANVTLRSLTFLFLIIALGLFARFYYDLDKYGSTELSLASPMYALAMTVIGILYSLFQLTSASFYLAMGKPMLPHLTSYIGDQVLMLLILTAGSALASYVATLQCIEDKICQRGAAGAGMELFAFTFILASSVLSTFYYYMKRD